MNSRASEIDVPATVACNQDISHSPGIRIQPTPLETVCWIGKSEQLPSRTAIPKGAKNGEHHETAGVGARACLTA